MAVVCVDIEVLECGCEDQVSESGVRRAWSWCGEHGGNPEPAGLYCCGECGFRSRRSESLESHVYREHLGARVR